MEALSGYAEWFWLMAKTPPWKDVENRDWPIPRDIVLPVRIYLHASKTLAPSGDIDFISKQLTGSQWEEFAAVDWQQYRGHIIGEITITRQMKKHTPNPISIIGTGGVYSCADAQAELAFLRQDCPEYFSKWFFGEFGFVVKDGVLYDHPTPCRGRPGFFSPLMVNIIRR